MIQIIADEETEKDIFYAIRHSNKETLMQILQSNGYNVKISHYEETR